MKKIKFLIILFLQFSLFQLVSAQSEKNIDLDNGRSIAIKPNVVQKEEPKSDRNRDVYRGGSDQDVPGKKDKNPGPKSEWVMPIDLDLLRDMMEDKNHRSDSDAASANVNADIKHLNQQMRQLMVENQQLKIDLKHIMQNIVSCCNASNVDPTDNRSGSFVLQSVPNPTTSSAFVSYFIPNSYDSASIKLIDLTGKVLKSFSISEIGIGKLNIDTEHLAAGSYIYTLVVDGAPIESKIMNVTK